MEPIDPTPEQIATATAAIRASWSDKVRDARLAAARGNIAWQPPILPATSLPDVEDIEPNA